MASTTTIRVTARARDLLAAQARARGISVVALIDDLARRGQLEDVFRREREAWDAEARVEDVVAEEAAWDGAAADGID